MIIFFTRHVRTLHTVIWLRMSCIMVSWYSCTCFVRGERRRNMTSAGWMTRRAGSGTVKEQLHRRQRTAGAAAAGCCDRGEDTSGATLDTRARRYKQSRRRHTCLTCCLISSFVALDDDISSGQRPGGPRVLCKSFPAPRFSLGLPLLSCGGKNKNQSEARFRVI